MEGMRSFRIAAVMLLANFIAIPVFAEETPLPAHIDQFRIGAGVGIHYGGYGVNAEYLPNRYTSLSAALGYFVHAEPGWAAGARVYPLRNDRAFNPRISGFGGRMATIKETNLSTGSVRYKAVNGGTLGGGFDWMLSKKINMDFDLFYLFEDLPAGVKKKDYVGTSLGIGMKF
jgi:hypothetical protein